MDAARVRCDGCDFAWYGADSAHGLSVLGHCPRCGGTLRFLEPVPAVSDQAGRGAARAGMQADPAGKKGSASQAGKDKGRAGSRFNRPQPQESEQPEPSRVLGVPLTWD